MDFGTVVAGISSILDAIRSPFQAGRQAWQNSSANGGNFWNNLGASLSTGVEELFMGDYQEKKELQSTIAAEDRAMANTRALRDEENAYNDPSAQAERLKSAGINPMSVLTNSNVAGASSTTVQSSGGQRSHTAPPNLSSLLSFAMAQADIDLKKAQADNLRVGTGKLTVETALAEWDVQLKKQLYNFNKENYPILLDTAKQKYTNLTQEYNNLVAKENYDKAEAEKVREEILKVQQETMLLSLQYYSEEQNILINTAKLKQMAQDFETGKYRQEYEKWKAEHEKVLSQIAVTSGKITEQEWHDLWESGLMKDKTEEEKRHIKEMANKLMLNNDIWENTKTGSDFVHQFFRRLMYIVTEIV